MMAVRPPADMGRVLSAADVEDDVKGDGNGLKVSVYGGGRDDTRRQDASTRTASPAGP